jgi:hypothetical protein
MDSARKHENAKRLTALLAVVALLMGVAIWLQRVRETSFALQTPDDEALYLKSGTAARRLTVAYRTLAADLYWIRAIQYYGGTKRMFAPDGTVVSPSAPHVQESRRRYDLLYPLLDLTTTLDPRFHIAYRFGAIFLAEPYPGGPGRPDLAIALLEKGLREQPDRWDYMQDIGFVHYWWRHDYEAAALWFGRAGQVPGAPWWLKSLAANTLAQGGDRRSSRIMWQALLQNAEIDWLRREAEKRLAQLKALDDIDLLQKQVDEFAARNGRLPMRWNVVPLDPSGTPYEIDVNGRVQLSRQSPLFPLPAEPATRPRS